MKKPLPHLSRFELQCLRRLWSLGEASVREIHASLADPPSYSTVRKIVERLQEKGAVSRVRLEGKAWVYRPAIGATAMLRKEIRRFLDSLFDGSAAPLVAQLAEMDALSLEEIREIERQLGGGGGGRRAGRSRAGGGRGARRTRGGEEDGR